MQSNAAKFCIYAEMAIDAEADRHFLLNKCELF